MCDTSQMASERIRLKQIGDTKMCILDTVQFCIMGRPGHQPRITLQTFHLARLLRERQGKVSESTKKIEYATLRPWR